VITIYPSVIYGLATGRLVDAGIQNSVPTALMLMAKLGLQRGQLGVVGPQKNVWGVVDIHDVANLYFIIFSAIVAGKTIPYGADGHYFAENGFLAVGLFQDKMAQALYELGALKTPEVSELTEKELEGTVVRYFGSNSRTSASRSRSIGWKPIHHKEEIVRDMKEYMRVMLEWDQKH